jgi:hypothetical protein
VASAKSHGGEREAFTPAPRIFRVDLIKMSSQLLAARNPCNTTIESKDGFIGCLEGRAWLDRQRYPLPHLTEDLHLMLL